MEYTTLLYTWINWTYTEHSIHAPCRNKGCKEYTFTTWNLKNAQYQNNDLHFMKLKKKKKWGVIWELYRIHCSIVTMITFVDFFIAFIDSLFYCHKLLFCLLFFDDLFDESDQTCNANYKVVHCHLQMLLQYSVSDYSVSQKTNINMK